MMRSSLFLSLVLSLAAAGCARQARPQAEGGGGPVTFPHKTHEDMGIACGDCHVGIDKATTLKQRHDPTVEKCKECHPDKAPPKREAGEPTLTFSHADHLPKVKGDCRRCHEKLPEPGMAAPPVPSMDTCTACHHHKVELAEARCRPCHVDLKRFPLKPVAFFSHEGDFIRLHGSYARNSAETCAQCHDQTYCGNCHSATTRPFKEEIQFPERVENEFIHRGDYVSRHQIEAAADPTSCRRCHGSGFCDSCHKDQSISPKSLNPRDPHPPGWSTRGGGTAFHGDAARQNLITCSGCHDQGAASVCVSCHKVGGRAGVSPHPAGFSKQHPLNSAGFPAEKNGMCLICHVLPVAHR